MSYQESLLQDNSYDSQAGHPAVQIPPSTEPRCWTYLRVVGLLLFFALVLFIPAILRGNNKREEPPFNYTYLSCKMDPTTHLCTTPYTLFQSTTFEPPNANETIVVRGHFDDIVEKTGWGSLVIQSFNVFDDTEQIKAVGYLEGFLTAARITDTMTNENATTFSTRPEDAQERLTQWLAYQQTYIQSQIDMYVTEPSSGEEVNDRLSAAPAQKEYWSAVNLVQLQHAGLKQGYEEAVKKQGQIPAFDLDLWANRADFGDVFANIYPERTKNCWDMTVGELDEYIGKNEHCSSISKATIDLIGSGIKCRPVKSHPDEAAQSDNDEPTGVILTKTIKVTPNTECDFTYTLDFAVAHDTWTSFNEMLRIIKVYKLQLNSYAKKIDQIKQKTSTLATTSSTLLQNIISTTISSLLELSNYTSQGYANLNHQIDPTVDEKTFILSLSGYPGALTSYDDYYVMPSPHQQLIVTETTNSNCSKELFTKISPRSILTTKRTLIAAMLSFDSTEWANTYARENSGTYNNQWMIVDGKKWDSKKVIFDITPATTAAYNKMDKIDRETTYQQSDFLAQVVKVNLDAGFYVIAEQMPGAVIIKDVTDFVNKNAFWPSFNRPYSQDVYFAMGFDRATEAWGDFYDYNKYARAQIMFRDLPLKDVTQLESTDDPAVTKPVPTSSLADLMAYMRYNDFKNDNLSQNCAIYAIASRYDLISDEGCGAPVSKTNARGQTDVKMATMNSIKRQSAIIGENEIQNALLTSVNVIDWTWNSDIHTYNTQKSSNKVGTGLANTLLQDLPYKKSFTNTTDAMFWVIAGPTTEQQPVFDWNDPKWATFSHVGLPDQFNFNWVQLNH